MSTWRTTGVLLGFKTDTSEADRIEFDDGVFLRRLTGEEWEGYSKWAKDVVADWPRNPRGRWGLHTVARSADNRDKAKEIGEHKWQRFATAMLCINQGNYGRVCLFQSTDDAAPKLFNHFSTTAERTYPLPLLEGRPWTSGDVEALRALWKSIWPYVSRVQGAEKETQDRGRLARAFNLFWASYTVPDVHQFIRLPIVCACIEALIGTGGRRSAKDFAYRLPALIATSDRGREELCRRAIEVYDMRSRMIHGAPYWHVESADVRQGLADATGWARRLFCNTDRFADLDSHAKAFEILNDLNKEVGPSLGNVRVTIRRQLKQRDLDASLTALDDD